MKHLSDFYLLIEEKCRFPKEACDVLNAVAKRLDEEPDFAAEFDRARRLFMFPKAHNIRRYLDMIKSTAEKHGVPEYTLDLVFLMSCSELLYRRFKARGVSDEIFWESMNDLRYKLLECMECKGVVGTFVASWFQGFYEVDRFALGRFQFEERDFPCDFTTSAGFKIKKGDACVNFHIPSSGVPLSDEVRFDAYKKAYDFFSHCRKDNNIYFICSSWLLYPRHREFLPENLNILRFMDDFEIFDSSEHEGFGDDWRVFGHYTDFPLEEWPEDTSLRKAYKKWLTDGNPTGHGCGVIVFDGEKILR